MQGRNCRDLAYHIHTIDMRKAIKMESRVLNLEELIENNTPRNEVLSLLQKHIYPYVFNWLRWGKFRLHAFDADEVSSETIFRLIIKIDDNTIKNKRDIRSLAIQIAINVVCDINRERSRSRQRLIGDADESNCIGELHAKSKDLADDPFRRLIVRELVATINEVLDKHPEWIQETYRRYRYDGEPASQIAESMGVSRRTIYNRVYRVDNDLKKNADIQDIYAMT